MTDADMERSPALTSWSTCPREWPTQPRRPVFVHSSFRTSSTWVWERFRQCPDTTAYYEIFNPGLANMTARHVMGSHHAAWDSGHPAQAPYFVEFLNLMDADTGIPEFDAGMAVQSFVPDGGFDGDLSQRERAYVDRLVRNAVENRKTPVLACTRTLGRSGALQKAYGGCHILLYRRLFDQWGSYSHHGLRGNSFFFDHLNEVIGTTKNDKFINNILHCFPLSAASALNENQFFRFLFFHLYLYGRAFEVCDIVFDAAACVDPDYRALIEGKIAERAGLSINLSGAKRNFEGSLLAVSDRRAFVDTVRQFTKIICGMADSPDGADFVSTLSEQLLEDWDQNEFYTRRTRTVHIDRLEALSAAERQNVLLGGEAEELRSALHLASVRAEDSDRLLAGLRVERDLLQARVAEVSSMAEEAGLAAEGLGRSNEDLDTQLELLAAHVRDLEVRIQEQQERDGIRAGVEEAMRAEIDLLKVQLSEALAQNQTLMDDVSIAGRRDEDAVRVMDQIASELALAREREDALAAENTVLRQEVQARTEAEAAIRQALEIRTVEDAARMSELDDELGDAHARNIVLEQKLRAVRAAPPTLKRRLARLGRKVAAVSGKG